MRKYLCLPFFLSILIFTSSGCATLRHPVPQDLIGKVRVSGMPEIRAVLGVPNPELQKNLIEAITGDKPGDYSVDGKEDRVYPMLSISGGSANGAYGAGLLKGWSDTGTRPKFKVVTGVSTGAITAPFAFLGKEYDDVMMKLYTTMSTKDVMRPKGPLQALFGDSFASNKPLAREISRYITDDMLGKIADEHRSGRRLFVGTALLDSQRFVAWDMGAIAVRGDKALFRKIILASASIPMIFPPVYIHVEADGKVYDEMHVDGGTITQVFTIYKILENAEEGARAMNIDMKKLGIDPAKIKGKYYIIRNGYVNPGYKVAKDTIASIAERSFDTMINYQGIGDTYRIYAFMQQRGNDYNLAFIPGDFRPVSKEDFDPQAMKALFDRGYQDAVKGYDWHKTPPGLEPKDN
ncbi:MAG: patatin-like phospholipase family protein [Candidatus Omnitrophica bacterium]|nr:patatin-like phospholipase family protein [Candidatus Omnitrophota bacterium]